MWCYITKGNRNRGDKAGVRIPNRPCPAPQTSPQMATGRLNRGHRSSCEIHDPIGARLRSNTLAASSWDATKPCMSKKAREAFNHRPEFGEAFRSFSHQSLRGSAPDFSDLYSNPQHCQRYLQKCFLRRH